MMIRLFMVSIYRRIVRALQLVYEALQRNIIRNGMRDGLTLSGDALELLDKVRNASECTIEQLKGYVNSLKENVEFKNFMCDAYKIIEGYNSPMTSYWLSFMEMVEILVMNIHAIKIQDWDMFLASIRLMVPWIQVYDNNKYGKWLVEFWLEMSNLPDSKVEYLKGGLFAQSITGKPYTCLPLDLWIEVTMNKG